MAVVWHGVPREMIGETIFSLDRLRTVSPGHYARQTAKYRGREAVLDCRVPILDVGFNDTVHCSPLHPTRLYLARKRAGFDVPARPEPPADFTGLFFEIPLDRILDHPVLWYSWKTLWINGAPDEDVPLTPPAEDFEPFDSARYSPLVQVRARHVDYLQRMRQEAKRPLLFVHIPHVLVAGTIDVSGCRVVAWDEQPSISSRHPTSHREN